MATKAKSRRFCVAAGHLLLKFVELVGLSLMNPYDNGISIKFVGKTTKYARVRSLGGIRVSCTVTLSPFGITEFYTKLAEAARLINLGHVGVTSAGRKL